VVDQGQWRGSLARRLRRGRGRVERRCRRAKERKGGVDNLRRSVSGEGSSRRGARRDEESSARSSRRLNCAAGGGACPRPDDSGGVNSGASSGKVGRQGPKNDDEVAGTSGDRPARSRGPGPRRQGPGKGRHAVRDSQRGVRAREQGEVDSMTWRREAIAALQGSRGVRAPGSIGAKSCLEGGE
jgi:hypothetical protein